MYGIYISAFSNVRLYLFTELQLRIRIVKVFTTIYSP
jgi:hypothetical protein